MTDPTLRPVLDRASDGVEPALAPQHAASAALARAHVVRRRRRVGAVAGTVAAVVVVATAVLGVPGSDRAEPPVAPSPPAQGVADDDVQPAFDPRTAARLPQRDSSLPATLQPPVAGADVAGLPMDGPARLVVGGPDSQQLLLLGQDGRWSSSRVPSEDTASTAISADGTMLAATGPGGLWFVDVRDGRWRELALPDDPVVPWTGPGVRLWWQDDDRVVLTRPGFGGLLSVPTDGGRFRSVNPVGRTRIVPDDLAPLPGGGTLALGDSATGRVLVEVRDGRVTRIVPTAALGRLSGPAVTEARMAATVLGIPREDRPTDRAGVLVAERGSYDATAYLPIANSPYTPGIGDLQPGGVAVRGWIDDDTVLLGTDTLSTAVWELVAWDVTTGEVSLVSRVSGGDDRTMLLGVATELLAPGSGE